MAKMSRVLALTGLVIGLAGVAFAQSEATAAPAKDAPGVYNLKTHTYQARPHRLVVPEATTAAKTYTGTLKFEITVKLVTPVASGQELICGASAGIDDYSTTTGDTYEFYDEEAGSIAKVSGTTATCTVSIPYSWSLEYATTDMISLSYDLQIISTSTSISAAEVDYRLHDSELPSIKVPTSGATTAIPISATI